MVTIKINGTPISVEEGTTILEAAKQNEILIPTLCYLKDLNEIAACRICVVEVAGLDRLVASCNTLVEDGMEIQTNSKRVLEARRNNLELLLSMHDCFCLTCVRSGSCRLQELAQNMDIIDQHYQVHYAENHWDKSLPLIRTDSKCVQCLRCINVCDKIQGMKVWDLLGMGRYATVGVREGKELPDVNCTYCGQCVTHCPVGALRERDDIDTLLDAIHDEDKVVVLQVAPAVRSAWGDGLAPGPDGQKLDPALATEKRMASAFRRMGVDYVFDTNFTADLTIMEEGNEFLAKMKNPDGFKRPLFTSCCPGWVRFLKLEYPEYVHQLSTAKSPQQMFGAVTKSYFAQKIGVDPEKIYCVSIMPCTAKKYECGVPEVNDAGAGPDVDLVLTTREVDRLIRRMSIHVQALP